MKIPTGVTLKWRDNLDDKSKSRVPVSVHIRDYIGIGRCKFEFEMTEEGALLLPIIGEYEGYSGPSIPLKIQTEMKKKGDFAQLCVLEKEKRLILVPFLTYPPLLTPPFTETEDWKDVEWVNHYYNGDKKVKLPLEIRGKIDWTFKCKVYFSITHSSQIVIKPIKQSFIPLRYVTTWNNYYSVRIPTGFFEDVLQNEPPIKWKLGYREDAIILARNI